MEIGTHWIEQMQTTIETMRRRCIAYYDQGGRVFSRIATAVNRGREIAEPAFKDAQDYAAAAMAITDGVDKLNTDTKNTLVELYLGIAVLLVGAGCGELAGATSLAPILDSIFHPTIETLLLIVVPIHAYIVTKKTPAIDDIERRVLLFKACAIMGILTGHLSSKVLSLVPAILFLQPLFLGLILDNALIKTPFVSDRYSYLGAVGVFSLSISVLCAFLPLGRISLAVGAFAALHALFGAVHFQMTTACLHDKLFSVAEASLAYILPLFFTQIVWANLFGVSSR
ncbi:unnamed protein product, partial [Mesorhabditis belari]|uniref:Uncharacterized protein n=1 Tax=Mesorhabditis belari TaxID=2138241 RepID=A0AAF3EES4_9BILA